MIHTLVKFIATMEKIGPRSGSPVCVSRGDDLYSVTSCRIFPTLNVGSGESYPTFMLSAIPERGHDYTYEEVMTIARDEAARTDHRMPVVIDHQGQILDLENVFVAKISLGVTGQPLELCVLKARQGEGVIWSEWIAGTRGSWADPGTPVPEPVSKRK